MAQTSTRVQLQGLERVIHAQVKAVTRGTTTAAPATSYLTTALPVHTNRNTITMTATSRGHTFDVNDVGAVQSDAPFLCQDRHVWLREHPWAVTAVVRTCFRLLSASLNSQYDRKNKGKRRAKRHRVWAWAVRGRTSPPMTRHHHFRRCVFKATMTGATRVLLHF